MGGREYAALCVRGADSGARARARAGLDAGAFVESTRSLRTRKWRHEVPRWRHTHTTPAPHHNPPPVTELQCTAMILEQWLHCSMPMWTDTLRPVLVTLNELLLRASSCLQGTCSQLLECLQVDTGYQPGATLQQSSASPTAVLPNSSTSSAKHKRSVFQQEELGEPDHRYQTRCSEMAHRVWLRVVVLVTFALVSSTQRVDAMTAVASTGEPCSIVVSPGDADVGIAVVMDASCKTNGGVGCIGGSVCRYCKKRATPQSQHLTACSDYTSAVSPAPVLPASIPSSGGATAASATATPQVPSAPASERCSLVVSLGDAGVGIFIATDAACKSSGGVGCIGGTSMCRYCKTRSTPQSQHLIDCGAIAPTPTQTPAPLATTATPAAFASTPATPPASTPLGPIGGVSSVAACTLRVSPGDATAGINIATDASCSGGGLGCINDACRYCRVRDTAQSGGFLSCALVAPPPTAPAPVGMSAPVPVSTLPSSVSPSPASAPSQPSCSLVVAKGDVDAGIAVVVDASCTSSGGVGCVGSTSVCRFCKTRSTAQSNHLLACSSLSSVTAPTPVPATNGVAYPPPADSCSNKLITSALASAGIWSVFDPACPRDADPATNDCNEFCRTCKFAETSASSRYRACAAVIAAVATAAAPTSIELVFPNPPPASACSATLSQDKVRAGVWMKATCLKSSTSSITCLETRCDFCKYFETSASANYSPCDDPVAINNVEVRVEQAAVAHRREPLHLEHQPRISSVSNDTERLSAIEYAVLVAAAIGIAAVFVFAAVGLSRALRIQREVPLAAE
ncbi:hypothetical protein PybrP1_005463 [[Pythium] brassicae (nom. inval.)]|nr:hypothetical protein PybrP1_005463 [[Pythium] brassicae (nom. inval.)]